MCATFTDVPITRRYQLSESLRCVCTAFKTYQWSIPPGDHDLYEFRIRNGFIVESYYIF